MLKIILQYVDFCFENPFPGRAKSSFSKSPMLSFPCWMGTLLAGLLFSGQVYAGTTYTWTQNSAATQDWSNTGNWAGGNPFVSATDTTLMFFGDTTTALSSGNNLITLNAPTTGTLNILTLNGLGAAGGAAANVVIGTNADTWTFGGASTTVNLNGLNGTTGLNYTVASNWLLSNTLTFQGDGTAGFTFSGNLSGGGGLTKSGNSVLTLSGSNSYTGATAVNAGVLVLANNNALSGTTISVANNAILGLSGSITAGAGQAVTITGAGSNALGALQSYSSGTNTWAGNVILGADFTRIGASAGTLVVSGTISGAHPVLFRTNGGSFIISGTSNTYSGATQYFSQSATDSMGVYSISNAGSASSLGTSGTIQLGGASNYGYLKYLGTGDTTNRVIDLASTTGGVTLDQAGSGVLDFTTAFTASGAGSKTLTLQGSTAGTGQIDGAIVDNSGVNPTSLIKSGTGTWILAGVNSYTGTTSVNAGVLIIQNSSALGTGSATVNSLGALQLQSGSGITVANALNLASIGVNNDGALLNVSGSNTYSGAITLTADSRINSDAGTLYLTSGSIALGSKTLTVGGGANTVVSSILSGSSGGLNKDGTGTVYLTNSNSFTGGISVSTGTLSVGDGSAGHDGSIASSSGIVLTNGSSALVYNLTGTANRTYSNIISGLGSLTVMGSGTLTLAGVNTFTGNTVVTGGKLILTNNLTLQNSVLNADSLASSITLGGATPTFGGLTGSGSLGTVINNSASIITLTLNNQSGITSLYTGNIANNGAGMNLVESGSGTQILSGSNSYTGSTTISSGTLQIGNGTDAGSIASTSAISISNSGSLVYNVGTGVRTLGAAISGSGSFILNNINSLTLNSNSNFAGTTTLNSGTLAFAQSGTTTFSGPLSGTSAINQNGTGLTIFSGSNTGYTGAITISSGTLKSAKAVSLVNMSSITMSNSGSMLAVNYGGANDYTQSSLTTLLGKTTFNSTTSALGIDTTNLSGTISSILSMPAGLTKLGANTLILTGTHTYTGATTISSGTLQLGDGTTNGAIPSSSAIVDNGALYYSMAASTTGTCSNLISGTGSLILSAGNNLSTLILTGSNSYTGVTMLNSGVLVLANNNAVAGTTGTISVVNNAELGLSGSITAGAGKTVSIVGPGGGNILGALQSTSSGTNTWAGNVVLGADGTRIGASAGTLAVSGTISGAHSILFKTNGGSVIVSGTNNTYSGVTQLIHQNATESVGVFSISNAGSASSLGTSGTIQLGSGGSYGYLKYLGTGNTTNRVIDLASTTVGLTLDQSGAGLLDFTSAFTASGAGSKTLTLQGSTTGTGKIDGAIVDNSGVNTTSLAKAGSGTWILAGANTYTGITTVNAGTLQFANESALYNSSTSSWTGTNLVVNSGASAAFNIGGTGEFTAADIATLSALGSGSNGFKTGAILGLDTTNIGGTGAGGTFTYSNSIANPNAGANKLGLTKQGTGTLVLNGSSSYTGTTTVMGGTLQIGDGSTGSIATTGTVSVGAGTTLALNLAGTGTFGNVVSNLGTVNLLQSGTTTLSGNLSGTSSSSINQNGSGVTILSGSNTGYYGAININSGQVKLSGSNAGNATVSSTLISVNIGAVFDVSAASAYTSGSTVSQQLIDRGTVTGNMTVGSFGALSGDGTVNGTVNVIGTLSPGVSGVGTLNTGALTLNNGSTLALSLGTTLGTKVQSSGAITLGSSSSDRIALSITLTAQPVDGTVYTILNGTGLTKNGLFTLNGSDWIDGGSFTVTTGGFSEGFTISYGATQDTLTAYAVPEPGTWELMAFGLTALSMFRRRRE